MRIPFIDRVYKLCVRERVINTECRTVSTKDGKQLTVGLSIRYSIGDAKQMLERVARPESTLTSLTLARTVELMAEMGSDEITPLLLNKEINDSMQSFDLDQWGFRGVRVYVVTFVYARVIRLIQMHDSEHGSSIDYALDEKPAQIN